MILSFSKKEFIDKILDGTKIHTIRQDKGNRWHAGKKIHVWYKNPRNVTQNPFPIEVLAFIDLEDRIPQECISTQEIRMKLINRREIIKVTIDSIDYYLSENGSWSILLSSLIRNDGFDSAKDFYDWFKPLCPFKGKIIHWTNFKY